MSRRSLRKARSFGAVVFLVLAGGQVRPHTAPAAGTEATVTRAGAALVYTAAPGVANNVRVEQLPAAVHLSDRHPIAPLTPLCVDVSDTERHAVICDVRDVTRLEIRLSDMADDVVATGLTVPVTFVGGTGNDRLVGGNAGDRFVADASVDGADVADGGPGSDTADYGARTVGVDVSLDDLPNDGTRSGTAEGDNIRVSVENVVGSSAADVLRTSTTPVEGAASPQTLIGNGGGDRIVGGRGDDTILGGPGKDRIDGGPGNDLIDAGADDDVSVDGNDGNDVISGGDGDDHVRGGDGTDNVSGGPGNDQVRGGPGSGDFCDGERGVDVEDQSDCETG